MGILNNLVNYEHWKYHFVLAEFISLTCYYLLGPSCQTFCNLILSLPTTKLFGLCKSSLWSIFAPIDSKIEKRPKFLVWNMLFYKSNIKIIFMDAKFYFKGTHKCIWLSSKQLAMVTNEVKKIELNVFFVWRGALITMDTLLGC